MNLKLAQLLEESLDLIIRTWVSRLQKEVDDYSRREESELNQTIREHLTGLLDVLVKDDETNLNEFVTRIAHMRSSMNFSLSSIERAFFIGKEVVCEYIRAIHAENVNDYLAHCKDIEILFLKSLFSITDSYARIREEQVAANTRKLAETEQSFITYRKLEKEKQKLDGILSAIGAGLSLIDADSNVVWYNEFAARQRNLTGGKSNPHCYQIHWDQNIPCEDCPARLTFQTGRMERVVRKQRSADGEIKYFQIDTIPVQNEEGQTHQVLELVQDVTEPMKLEQEFLKAERLASLGKMAAKVAHEIRNPLSSISLNTELLEDEINSFEKGSTNEANALLASITSEIDRLVSFTEEYLQFYRLPELKFETCQLNQLIKDLLEFLQPELTANLIEVDSFLSDDLPEVQLDSKQIRQALINMLRNSKEAMPTGGRIKISTRKIESSIELEVSDTGSGIESEHRSEIFELFYSTKRDGTGLGLPITRQIVEGHGGKITCDTTAGRGTSFTLTFPLRDDEKGATH